MTDLKKGEIVKDKFEGTLYVFLESTMNDPSRAWVANQYGESDYFSFDDIEKIDLKDTDTEELEEFIDNLESRGTWLEELKDIAQQWLNGVSND
ncbi:MAG: hypothetical protein AAF442_09410 [Pseudomonadota bacterium]